MVGTCIGVYRFVCAKEMQGMQGVGTMGILGLKGSTGRGLLRAMMNSQGIEKEEFAFYQGYQENRLFLG